MKFPILSCLLLLPLAGAVIIVLIKPVKTSVYKRVALFSTAANFILTIAATAAFDKSGGFQMVEKVVWSETIGLSYHVGVDGISLPLVFLTSLLALLALGASWKITDKAKGYFSLLLLLETGMLGVFLSLDYILFYIFWELVLLPMYFLIGMWGGKRRDYAAFKFFLYTLVGSVIMLLAILALYSRGGSETFDIMKLASRQLPAGFQYWIFWGFFAGFAVKIPIFPLHTWLPDAHVEAPTAVSVLLAGILLKMGAYGFIRVIVPTTPAALEKFGGILAVLAVISIIYGALNATIQKDLKRMVAYSSISHMGYVVLGIASFSAAGLNGAVLQLFSHGLITAMLFLIIGYVYERTHTRLIPELGGLLTTIPVLSSLLCFAAFAALGMPGLSGFMAELMILVGTFGVMKWAAVFASIGVVITAGYLLWMLQRVVMGLPVARYKGMADASPREVATLLPLVALIVTVGLYPDVVVSVSTKAVETLLGK